MLNNGSRIKKYLCAVIIVALVAVAIFLSVVRVQVGQVGLITRFERATGDAYGEGFHFVIPFVTKVIMFDTRIQDMDEITTQGELSGRETVALTIQMKYRLNTSKIVDIYRVSGRNYRDSLMPQSEILDIVKATIATYSIDEFAPKRSIIGGDVLEQLNKRFEERGIIFTSFAISNYNFDSAMEAAISEANAAAQEQKTQAIRIQTEKERAQADKEIAIVDAEKEAEVKVKSAQAEADAIKIKAEADAEANNKINASITEELIRYKEVEKWNGSKASVITNGSVITDASQNPAS